MHLFPTIPNGTNVFDIILERIQDDIFEQSTTYDYSNNIASILSIYDSQKGIFKDINYQKFYKEENLPMKHLERLYEMSIAYTYKSKNNPYYKDKNILRGVLSGLEFWSESDFNCWNWWYNEIKEPQVIGLTLIVLRKGQERLDKNIEDKLLLRIAEKGGTPSRYTGANKTDIALHWLYRACLKENKALLKDAVYHAYETIKFAPFREGLQPDYSFFQHNTQFYVGGYGEEFLRGILQFAYYTNKTDYALDSTRLDIIVNFALHSYFNLIRGQYFFMNAIGRSMSREDASLAKRSTRYANYLIKIDPHLGNKKVYKNIISRLENKNSADKNIKNKNITYYIGDYVAHIRSKYSVGIRTVSLRTMRSEHGNRENTKTYFLSDGSMHVSLQGDEYYNIFPIWDWSRIPGVTNPHYEFKDIPETKSGITRGTQKLVGGASDSLYSVNTYYLNDHYKGINTSAYKSWFFFDDEVICLGSDISSSSELPINTTVNQSWLDGDVTACAVNDKFSTLPEGIHSFNKNLKWVLHNDIGYVFPSGGKLMLKNIEERGSWKKLNTTQSNREIVGKVFTLWFDHGIKPLNQKYAYIIVPNITNTSEMLKYDVNNINIVSNTDSLQAVYHTKLDILECVFLKPGILKNNYIELSSDKPVTLIIKGFNTDEISIHIADPTQSKSIITLEISLNRTRAIHKRKIFADFRDALLAGKTKKYTIIN